MNKDRIVKRLSEEVHNKKKKVVQLLESAVDQKKILFIIGCQRSGTTLMLRIFENDLRTQTYGEFSILSDQDEKEKLRLNPLNEVKDVLDNVSANFIVMKPLVETQNILELLDYFEGSRTMWMYRDYRDVAASNLKRFGMENGCNIVRPIYENDQDNWLSQKLSDEARQPILDHFSEDMNPYDAAVLFWYARNCLYFDLGLDKKPEILMNQYKDLVTNPVEIVSGIYERIGEKYPGAHIHKEITASSVRKGRDIPLKPEIEKLAIGMMERLDAAYLAKKNA